MQQMVLGPSAPGQPASGPAAPQATSELHADQADPGALIGNWTLQLTRTWDTCEPEDAPEIRQTYTWRVDQAGDELTATVTDGVTVFRTLHGTLSAASLILEGQSQDGKLVADNLLNAANLLGPAQMKVLETHLLGTTEYRLALQPDGELVGRRVVTYPSREARKTNSDGVEWYRWYYACASEYAVVARRL